MEKRLSSAVFCGVAAAAVLVLTGNQSAEARPAYMGWWSEKYPDVVKQHEVSTKVKCNVCHEPGSSKKPKNAYGKAIEKALDGKKNLKKDDKDTFIKAADKAAGEKSGTEGKTFGDLLKAKELPVKGK